MRIFWISTATTASLFVVTLTTTPTLAAANQSVDRGVATSTKPASATKAKPADSKPSSTKPVSTTGVTTTTASAKKDRPGKRFWGRIMDHFRDIHSAEKKPKQ
ncbi:hypothetical protein ACAW74_04020 [Fibrella sp. WM1]|uniref:hypothetical protein n=1 Tax=Fibrella musci TaxID=3242485 RepID=UPI0035215BFA